MTVAATCAHVYPDLKIQHVGEAPAMAKDIRTIVREELRRAINELRDLAANNSNEDSTSIWNLSIPLNQTTLMVLGAIISASIAFGVIINGQSNITVRLDSVSSDIEDHLKYHRGHRADIIGGGEQTFASVSEVVNYLSETDNSADNHYDLLMETGLYPNIDSGQTLFLVRDKSFEQFRGAQFESNTENILYLKSFLGNHIVNGVIPLDRLTADGSFVYNDAGNNLVLSSTSYGSAKLVAVAETEQGSRVALIDQAQWP